MSTTERVLNRQSLFDEEYNFSDLKGTAFDINRQIELLLQSRNKDRWCKQTEEDLHYLYLEFLEKLRVIPFDMTVRDGRLYCGNYQKFFLDTVSEEERNGATRFSISQIHKFLMESDVGSMAAFVSPRGWAPPYGEYHKTQIYLFKKSPENSVEAVTLVVQMSLDECEDYLKSFGRGGKRQAETDESLRIEDVVIAPIFVNSDNKFDFEDFVWPIRNVSNEDIDTLLSQLGNREQLKQIRHSRIVEILESFTKEVKKNVTEMNDPEQVAWLKQFLKRVVLEISAAYRGVDMSVPRTSSFYREELYHFQKASQEGPCPTVPSINNQQVILGVGGPRVVGESGEVIRCVTCPFCGKTVDARVVNGRIYCEEPPKGCGKSAPVPS